MPFPRVTEKRQTGGVSLNASHQRHVHCWTEKLMKYCGLHVTMQLSDRVKEKQPVDGCWQLTHSLHALYSKPYFTVGGSTFTSPALVLLYSSTKSDPEKLPYCLSIHPFHTAKADCLQRSPVMCAITCPHQHFSKLWKASLVHTHRGTLWFCLPWYVWMLCPVVPRSQLSRETNNL